MTPLPGFPTPGIRSAVAALLGRSAPTPTPLQESRGDLGEAFARVLGIPLAQRPAVDPLDARRLVPNRADRRRTLREDEHARSLRLDTYSRRLTAKAGK